MYHRAKQFWIVEMHGDIPSPPIAGPFPALDDAVRAATVMDQSKTWRVIGGDLYSVNGRRARARTHLQNKISIGPHLAE